MQKNENKKNREIDKSGLHLSEGKNEFKKYLDLRGEGLDQEEDKKLNDKVFSALEKKIKKSVENKNILGNKIEKEVVGEVLRNQSVQAEADRAQQRAFVNERYREIVTRKKDLMTRMEELKMQAKLRQAYDESNKAAAKSAEQRGNEVNKSIQGMGENIKKLQNIGDLASPGSAVSGKIVKSLVGKIPIVGGIAAGFASLVAAAGTFLILD